MGESRTRHTRSYSQLNTRRMEMSPIFPPALWHSERGIWECRGRFFVLYEFRKRFQRSPFWRPAFHAHHSTIRGRPSLARAPHGVRTRASTFHPITCSVEHPSHSISHRGSSSFLRLRYCTSAYEESLLPSRGHVPRKKKLPVHPCMLPTLRQRAAHGCS